VVLGIIFSIYNTALIASYGITISCVLMHRLRGRRLPDARYSLGKWGALVNICALVYLAPIFIFTLFPSAPNPTAANMNWACVMVGGVVILATVYYMVWGRKVYSPPKETVEDYIERYQDTTASSEKEVSSEKEATSEKEVSGGFVEESTEAEKEVSGGLVEESAEAEKRDM
jgi:amino acid transporter